MKTAKELIEQKISSSEKLDEYFHEQDDLLRGLTFEDLITAVASNIPSERINPMTVNKQYQELLRMQMRDAEYELKRNMKQIIQAAIEGY